ncbi:hypothetical protein NLG97_g10621 [Lecanicillium saksenae]|uniref:Uncharacterized protein n=1 Tax=Lecanicillium saksenae TaxID=468837 RepID=A0ACC1QE06_9HYPO|nr:hypothetical protein NLG97_g10621 [Lecanicillium saksenae]
METLDIEDYEKERLQEVADGMLAIYRTLARIYYLDPEAIEEGPHDITDNIPVYRAYGLDDAVIYLYSILPYVDTSGSQGLGVFMPSEFADFRDTSILARSRNPFGLKTLIYCTRRHLLWRRSAVDIEFAVDNPSDDLSGAPEQMSDDGSEASISHDARRGEEDEACPIASGHPAAAELRNINESFMSLRKLPGEPENAESVWRSRPSVTRRLCEKPGWHQGEFDGEGLLASLAREYAAGYTRERMSAELTLLKRAQKRKSHRCNNAKIQQGPIQAGTVVASTEAEGQDRFELWMNQFLSEQDGDKDKEELAMWESRTHLRRSCA